MKKFASNAFSPFFIQIFSLLSFHPSLFVLPSMQALLHWFFPRPAGSPLDIACPARWIMTNLISIPLHRAHSYDRFTLACLHLSISKKQRDFNFHINRHLEELGSGKDPKTRPI
jgi:hypothetical protein